LGGCLWKWATAIEPYSSQMIDRNGKVNRLPQRRSRNASEGELPADIGMSLNSFKPAFRTF
jgi:hypothetical protein